MRNWLRAARAGVAEAIDRRDILALVGISLLGYGGEMLLPGLGYAAAGAVLVTIAVRVR